MNTEQRKKLLKHLASKADEDTNANAALKNEVANIANALAQETEFVSLISQLDFLEVIWFCEPEEAIEALSAFLSRLEALASETEDARILSLDNRLNLTAKTIDLVIGFRYYDTCVSKVLDILFDYSLNSNELIAKKSSEGIKTTAHYNLDVYKKIGITPQKELLKKIANFDDAQLFQNFSSVGMVCREILSPTMESTSWTYNKLTWYKGSVPTNEGTQNIRAEAIAILKKLYPLASNYSEKKQVIDAIESAVRTPTDELDSKQQESFTQDTITVLKWLKEVIETEQDMLILQKVEHKSYWISRRASKLEREPIRKASLEIKDILYEHKEYKIFRVLIGFQSIFHDWEQNEDNYNPGQDAKKREELTYKLAEEVSKDNFSLWEGRILEFAKIESNDGATFPYFRKFLEYIGKLVPCFALEVLEKNSDDLERFSPSILSGLMSSEQKTQAYKLMKRWCEEGQYLYWLTVFCQFSATMEKELLSNILKKAIENKDIATLSQIISAISSQYKEGEESLLSEFFIPALEELSKFESGWYWVHEFWYLEQRSMILKAMDLGQQQILLDSLVMMPKIDYHAEAILIPIAEERPELILDFFCSRFHYKEKNIAEEAREKWDERYEEVPFSLNELAPLLANNASLVMEKVLPTFEVSSYGMFVCRGGMLVHNIFPEFSDDLEAELIQLVKKGEEKYWLYVLGILRNYKGQEFTHSVCKELVIAIPEHDDILREVMICLRSEGVVSGEYGMAESYERKAQEILPWKEDADSKVRLFAEEYISVTEEMAKNERERADENITLRKHQYGVEDTD